VDILKYRQAGLSSSAQQLRTMPCFTGEMSALSCCARTSCKWLRNRQQSDVRFQL